MVHPYCPGAGRPACGNGRGSVEGALAEIAGSATRNTNPPTTADI
ncbi:hypothetical protein [Streptomyces sp. NPDC049949]